MTSNLIYMAKVIAPITLIFGIIMLFINSQKANKTKVKMPRIKPINFLIPRIKPINFLIQIAALISATMSFLPFANIFVFEDIVESETAIDIFMSSDEGKLGLAVLAIMLLCILVCTARYQIVTVVCAIINIIIPIIAYITFADDNSLGRLIEIKPAFWFYCYTILYLVIIGLALYTKFKITSPNEDIVHSNSTKAIPKND